MVNLDVVHASNAALVQSQHLVAVFFGGTSGIGHNTIKALAKATADGGKGFRAYIVGRNTKAAEDIIAECRGIYPQGEFKFVKADDLSLIHDVDRTCAEITQLEEKEKVPRIDYLMLTQGNVPYAPRKGMFKLLDLLPFLTIP
jgi:NAD(P)-dependent dehydrogenase (short-subunit alcohol dehydrogenase family)